MAEWVLQSCVNYGSWNRAAGAEENAQLKKLVADLSLDKQMLQDVIKKMRPPRGCEASLQEGNGKLACVKLPGFDPEGLPLCEVGQGNVLL